MSNLLRHANIERGEEERGVRQVLLERQCSGGHAVEVGCDIITYSGRALHALLYLCGSKQSVEDALLDWK